MAKKRAAAKNQAPRKTAPITEVPPVEGPTLEVPPVEEPKLLESETPPEDLKIYTYRHVYFDDNLMPKGAPCGWRMVAVDVLGKMVKLTETNGDIWKISKRAWDALLKRGEPIESTRAPKIHEEPQEPETLAAEGIDGEAPKKKAAAKKAAKEKKPQLELDVAELKKGVEVEALAKKYKVEAKLVRSAIDRMRREGYIIKSLGKGKFQMEDVK